MRDKAGRAGWWLTAALIGLLAVAAGCDPTLRATVEDGVISVSTSYFGALLRALIALGQEAQQANDPNSTAMLMQDAAGRVFA